MNYDLWTMSESMKNVANIEFVHRMLQKAPVPRAEKGLNLSTIQYEQ